MLQQDSTKSQHGHAECDECSSPWEQCAEPLPGILTAALTAHLPSYPKCWSLTWNQLPPIYFVKRNEICSLGQPDQSKAQQMRLINCDSLPYDYGVRNSKSNMFNAFRTSVPIAPDTTGKKDPECFMQNVVNGKTRDYSARAWVSNVT